MKRITGLLIFFLCSSIGYLQAQKISKGIAVTKDGHFFQYNDGSPFFWLGDTAWELFHRLTKEEINKYLDNRKSKGFNVIQAVILAEMDGLQAPNKEGEVPFNGLDPSRPNEAYFRFVDWVVNKAAQKGLFIALLPTWGDKVMKAWGKGPVVFNEKNAYQYGLFLAERYAKFANVIWIAGGDRPAYVDTMDTRPIWRAMIKGLRKGNTNKNLITYHPAGESSSTNFWKEENILDFNMLQSGHARKDIPVWEWVLRDRSINPTKPIIDGEPSYEDHPINWKKANGYFNDYDIRKQVYRSVFSGAAGVTYGHHSVWQFYSKEVPNTAFAKMYWYEALNRPAATQMQYLKQLIETRCSNDREPDQRLVLDKQHDASEYIAALKCQKNKLAMFYLPVAKAVQVDLSWFESSTIKIEWFEPSSGKIISKETAQKQNQMSFIPPKGAYKKDWVLLVSY
ncbi:apiosidase-like domain-containing protein [Olivibacter domesticus]|uniref:Putative collagen-binding domain of a collagenase n=1 Tax=Olivibacter domesticus TaxID=407022 RepID=A0A1H7TG02_OLID1|nr:DUF4038 domain-containing protein [Olivibacter domesticus]SEL83643.1 Putative collagen-binding domain of a collagenase [Olivibacter domesticus]